MCQHQPECPPAEAVDHDAAKVVAHDELTGYSLLCNGVIVFSDGGEIAPDGTITGELHNPAPHAQPASLTARVDLTLLHLKLVQAQLQAALLAAQSAVRPELPADRPIAPVPARRLDTATLLWLIPFIACWVIATAAAVAPLLH